MKYLSLQRWNSYWYQLFETTQCPNVKTILEVGIGNTICTSVLRNMGYTVKTLDADPTTQADYVADIRTIQQTVHETFDLTLCCQTLEHIPYEDVPGVLRSFHKITNTWLIVTLPYTSLGTFAPRLFLKLLPFMKPFKWVRVFPFFPKEHPSKLPGGHYWEIGKKGYALKTILQLFDTCGWDIVKHYSLFENPYHYMLVCKKRT